MQPGVYTIGFSGDPGTMYFVEWLLGLSASNITHAADTAPKSTFLDKYRSRTLDTYVDLQGGDGSVTVSVDGDSYALDWTFDLGGGDTITGSYTGPVANLN